MSEFQSELEVEEEARCTHLTWCMVWGRMGSGLDAGCRGQKILGFVHLGGSHDDHTHNDTQCTSGENVSEVSLGLFRKGQGGEAQQGTRQSGTADGVHVGHGIVDDDPIPIIEALAISRRGEQKGREDRKD